MSRFFRPENQALVIEQRTSKEGRVPAGAGRPFWRLPIRVWQIFSLSAVLFVLSAWYHYAIYLPQPDQPHRLMILDDVFALGVALLVLFAGLILGRRALRPFNLEGFSRLERAALAIGVGWGIMSLAILALGLAHLLYLWILLIGLGIILLAGWREIWSLIQGLAMPAWYRSLSRARPRGFWEWALAAPIVAEMALLSTEWLAPYPPLAYDLYQYHWAVPKLYLLHHAIYAFPGWAHANFPFQSEMLDIPALALNAPGAALFIQASYGLLAVFLIASYLSRRFGRLAAWLGVALCLCSPLYTVLLSDTYVELALTYAAVASLLVLLSWYEARKKAIHTHNWRLLLLTGLLVGFGVAAKYTEGQIVLGMVLLLAVLAAMEMLDARKQRERLFPLLGNWVRNLLVYGVGAALPLLPWLAKDWAQLGNPIYPFLWGGPGWDDARTQVGVVTLGHFGPQGSLWHRLLFAFFGLFFDTHRSGEPFLLPPNDLLLIVVLVPLVLLAQKLFQQRVPRFATSSSKSSEMKQTTPWLIVAIGAYIAWVMSQALVGRYATPWVLLLVVPVAVMVSRLAQWCWRIVLLRFFSSGLILLFLAFFGPFISLAPWVQANPLSLVAGQVSLHQWEQQHVMDASYWAMVEYVNTDVPPAAKVLLVGRGTGYFLDGRDFIGDSGEDWIPYLETEGRTPAGMLAVLHHYGIGYIVYEEKILDFVVTIYGNSYLGSFLPAFRQFLSSSLKQVWSYQNFHVYQVPPP